MIRTIFITGWLLSHPFLYGDHVTEPELQSTPTKSDICPPISDSCLGAYTTFVEMLGQQMVHAAKTAPIHTAINMAIGQEKFGDAFTSSLRQGVGHAIGASLAHQLGKWYSGPDKINYFMHKMGHFASGAVGGAITADDPLGGAFGAAFAEVSMEAMADVEKVSQEIYQEDPNLSISEVKAIVKERLIAKRFFSQVIAGFAGTLAGGDFSVAANSAAIALDYNMEPTLTGAAVSAYLAQQIPALTAFLASPRGALVAASLGITALSMDQIKENLTLLGKLHQVYVMVLRGEIGTDSEGRLYNKKGGDQGSQIFTQSSSRAAAGGMPPEFEPDDEDLERKKETGKHSKQTEDLLGKTDKKYKGELLERSGQPKDATTLRAAQVELRGQQIAKASERGVTYDHISKAKAAKEGLIRHIGKINDRLSWSALPASERVALEQELSKASRLLDHAKTFVP